MFKAQSVGAVWEEPLFSSLISLRTRDLDRALTRSQWASVERTNKASIQEQKIRCAYLPAEDGSGNANGIPEEEEGSPHDTTHDTSRLDESVSALSFPPLGYPTHTLSCWFTRDRSEPAAPLIPSLLSRYASWSSCVHRSLHSIMSLATLAGLQSPSANFQQTCIPTAAGPYGSSTTLLLQPRRKS